MPVGFNVAEPSNLYVRKPSQQSIENRPIPQKEDYSQEANSKYFGKQENLNHFELSLKFHDPQQQEKLSINANRYQTQLSSIKVTVTDPPKIFGQWQDGIIDVNYNHVRITHNKDSNAIGEFFGVENSGTTVLVAIGKENNTNAQIELVVDKFIDQKFNSSLPRIKIAKEVIKEQMPKIVDFIQQEADYELKNKSSFNITERLVLYAIKQNVPEKSTKEAWHKQLCDESAVKFDTILKEQGVKELEKYARAGTDTVLYSELIRSLNSFDHSYEHTALSQAAKIKEIAKDIYEQAVNEIKDFDNNCKALFNNKEFLIRNRMENLEYFSSNTDLQDKLTKYENYKVQTIDVAILNKNTAETTVLSLFLIEKSNNEYILLDPNYRGIPEYRGNTAQEAVNNYLNGLNMPDSRAIVNLDNDKTPIKKDYPPEGTASKAMSYWAGISIGAAVFSMFAPADPISKGVAISGVGPMLYYAGDSIKSLYHRIDTNSFDWTDPKIHLDIAQMILALSIRKQITPASMAMFAGGNALLLEGMGRTVAEETHKHIKQGNYKKAAEVLTTGIYSAALTLAFIKGQKQVSFKDKFLTARANTIAAAGNFKRVVSGKVSVKEMVTSMKGTAKSVIDTTKNIIAKNSNEIVNSAKKYSEDLVNIFKEGIVINKTSISNFNKFFSSTLMEIRTQQLQELNIIKNQALKTGEVTLMKEYSLKLAKLEQTTMIYLKEYVRAYIEMSDITIKGSKIKYGQDYELIPYGRLGLKDHNSPVSTTTDFDLKLICKNREVREAIQSKVKNTIFNKFVINIDMKYFFEDLSTIQQNKDFFAYFYMYLPNSNDINRPLIKELATIYKNAGLVPYSTNKRAYSKVFDFLLGNSSQEKSIKFIKEHNKIPNHIGLKGVNESNFVFSQKYYGKRMGDMMIFMEHLQLHYPNADKIKIKKISDFCCNLETYNKKNGKGNKSDNDNNVITSTEFNKLMQDPGQRKLILNEAKELGLITDKQIAEYGQNYNKIGFEIFNNIVRYMDKQYIMLEQLKTK